MTLDEAIKHYDEVIKELEEDTKELEEDAVKYCIDNREFINDWIKYTNEHKQLAEWLRELKAYRDDRDDCDYETLKIKLENAEDVIRGLQEDLRDAREELRWR